MSAKTVLQKLRDYVLKELRYRMTVQDIDRSVFHSLTKASEEEVSDLPSRESVLRDHLVSYMATLFTMPTERDEEARAVCYHLAEVYPETPEYVGYALKRALVILQKVEGMGRAINVKLDALRTERENPVLQRIFALTLDWRFAYGLGALEVPENPPEKHYNKAKTWLRFTALLQRFSKKSALSDADRARLNELFLRMPLLLRKWCSRIVLRDLKIYVAATTARRIWPSLIPLYSVQLPTSIPKDAGSMFFDTETGFPTLLGSAPKFDGLRIQITVTNSRRNQGHVRSRSGLDLPQHADLIPQAAALVRAAGLRSAVLDGEGQSKTTQRWNEAASAWHSKTMTEEERATRVLRVFDLIPCIAFERQSGKATRMERYTRLSDAFTLYEAEYSSTPAAEHSTPNLELVPIRVFSPDEKPRLVKAAVFTLYDEYRASGEEGAIFYDMNAPYASGDSAKARLQSGMLRLKPFQTEDVEITKVLRGAVGKKYENVMGAFVCKKEDGTEIQVGGGFTDAERAEYFKLGKKLVGRVIEIESQIGAPGIKSRHANFVRLRPAADKVL